MTPPGRFVWRGNLPTWLALLAAPVAILFLLSLLAAGVLLLGGTVLAALLLPRLRRWTRRDGGRTIELEPSAFRRLPGTDADRDDRR